MGDTLVWDPDHNDLHVVDADKEYDVLCYRSIPNYSKLEKCCIQVKNLATFSFKNANNAVDMRRTVHAMMLEIATMVFANAMQHFLVLSVSIQVSMKKYINILS